MEINSECMQVTNWFNRENNKSRSHHWEKKLLNAKGFFCCAGFYGHIWFDTNWPWCFYGHSVLWLNFGTFCLLTCRVHNGTILLLFLLWIFWMKWQSSTQIEFHGHYVFIVNWVTNGFTCFSLCLLLFQVTNRMNFIV